MSDSDTDVCLTQLDLKQKSLKNVLEKDLSKCQILTISDSYVPNLRALSSNLRSLTVLKIANAGIDSIDGISMCPVLKELFLPFNEISELSPLIFLHSLEIIDLEQNCIASIEQVEYLSALTDLKILNLQGNPVVSDPKYRKVMEVYEWMEIIF